MRRRNFITLLGGAAVAWPCNGWAQSPPKRPLIGFLGASSKTASARYYSSFAIGMRELGYLEGRDYGFEDRYANGDVSRMPSLAEELVGLKPDVIVASATAGALAAKQASTSIPIVGVNLTDPVNFGLVVSEARPGTNVTGILFRLEGMAGKQVEIALDLMPGTSKVGILVDVDNPSNAGQLREVRDLLAAAAIIGLKVEVLKAGTDSEIDAAFASAVHARTGALLVEADPLFITRIERLVALAARHGIPTMYSFREYVVAGGLISYGTSLIEDWRQIGLYTGRILKGEKPADLPVIQATKIQLIINLKTAKTLGLEVPATLLALADEVIE